MAILASDLGSGLCALGAWLHGLVCTLTWVALAWVTCTCGFCSGLDALVAGDHSDGRFRLAVFASGLRTGLRTLGAWLHGLGATSASSVGLLSSNLGRALTLGLFVCVSRSDAHGCERYEADAQGNKQFFHKFKSFLERFTSLLNHVVTLKDNG